MRALGLDLATTLGWAEVAMECGPPFTSVIDSGSLRLGEGEDDLPKCLTLRNLLDDKAPSCGVVAYENCVYHTSIRFAHLFAALRTTVQLWCHDNRVRCLAVSVQAGKAALTGRGNATKEQSVAAALKRFDIVCTTHDEADAIGVALAALK